MKKLFITLALLAPISAAMAQTAPATAPATAAVDPNKVILEAGDFKMTAGEFEAFIDSLPEQVQSMARGPGKRMLADKLAEIKLLSSEARKQGLAADPKTITAIKMAEDQILAQALAEKVSRPDEAAIKAEYEKDKSKYDQLSARHILIRSGDSAMPPNPNKKALTTDEAKKKADEIRDRIVNKKEDFATIAKAESDDTGSGARGGDLGFFSRGQMVGPFEEAAYGLKPGEVSQPVKTIFGWHIIQLNERKTTPLEEVIAQAGAQQANKKVEELVAELKKNKGVKLDDGYFGTSTLPAGHP